MFSITTIESSTRMPIVSASASSVMMFRLKPMKNITRNVEISEVGIESKTMNELRQACKNSSSTTPVSSTARLRSKMTESIERRVKIDVSLVIVIVTSLGK